MGVDSCSGAAFGRSVPCCAKVNEGVIQFPATDGAQTVEDIDRRASAPKSRTQGKASTKPGFWFDGLSRKCAWVSRA